MNFNDYTPLAMRTIKDLGKSGNIEHAKLLIISEIGELADCFKKHFVYNKELDHVNLLEEAGDILWGAALLAHTLEVSVDYTKWDSITAGPVETIFHLNRIASAIADGDMAFNLPRLVSKLNDFLGQFGHTLEEAMLANIAKLKARYPDGYSNVRALDRNILDERKALGA